MLKLNRQLGPAEIWFRLTVSSGRPEIVIRISDVIQNGESGPAATRFVVRCEGV
jgi:hypothetical protein